MDPHNWTDSFLDGLREEGDPLGDKLVSAILSPVEPREVRAILGGLTRAVAASRGALQDVGAVERVDWADGLRDRLKEAEFRAGTSAVLQGLKVAEAALFAARTAWVQGDRASGDRFRDTAAAVLESAQRSLEDAAEAHDAGDLTHWYTPEYKRNAYNRLVSLSDYLAVAPEIVAAPGSDVAHRLSLYPSLFKEYFAPVPAPVWVDERKLERAAHIWDKDNLFVLLTLFAGSLPYCYLDRKGIPLLYETGKLVDEQYISQRLYETGLMLQAVMCDGGIHVGYDVSGQRTELDRAARAEGVSLLYDRRGLPIWDGVTDEQQTRIKNRVVENHPTLADRQRFLSGKGVLYARKVRLLHAAMRHMAQGGVGYVHAEPKAPNSRACLFARLSDGEWHPDDGVPINQEDMAYTLLTFAWVIPRGLERWGRAPDEESTAAFLHAWKVVGHLMGIRDNLLTDDPDEAREMFGALVRRVKGEDRIAMRSHRSDAVAEDVRTTSQELTGAIVSFLQNYLPRFLHGLPAAMIEDQVGRENAEVLIGAEERPGTASRAIFGVIVWVSRIHGVMDRLIYQRSRLLQGLFTELMREVSVAFIDSWRGPLERRPFYIPNDLQRWQMEPNRDLHYHARLDAWRHRLFGFLAMALLTLMTGSVAVLAGVVGSVLTAGIGFFEKSLLVSIPLFIASFFLMRMIILRTVRQRPTR
jgi:hypothetical protein